MGSFAATHFTFHQGFDSVGNRTELRGVHGTSNDFKNTYTYDKLRRLTEVSQTSQPGGNAVLPKRVALEYNALGQRTKISRFESTGTTNAVATTDFTYDFANRLSSIAHKKGTTNLNTHSYTYDPLSRLRSITSTLDGTINYTYDQRSQLTIADDGQPYSPGHPTRLGERYQYDANGNREGTGFTVLADNDNRITAAPGETYTYDNEGNVISMITSIGVGSKSFQWDHRNRLTQSTVNTSSGIMTVNYAYDPFNRLVKRSAGFNTTYFGYDEGINPHLQMDTQTNNQITHRYLWSDQVDELFADEQRLSGLVPDTKWALSDHQGTIKDIADFNSSTGQTSVRHRAYDSFGNRKGSALPTDIVFGYTGKYFDEATGMQNSWNRWYSPKMGRFISQDPIGFAAGDANLYRYVGNGPTNKTDPSGLEETWSDWWWSWISPVTPTEAVSTVYAYNDAPEAGRTNRIQQTQGMAGGNLNSYLDSRLKNQNGIGGGVVHNGLTDVKTVTTTAGAVVVGVVAGAASKSKLGSAPSRTIDNIDIQVGMSKPSQKHLLNLPEKKPVMLGQNGVRTPSTTVWKGKGKERIDVENPNPGQRPGQIHYQGKEGILGTHHLCVLRLDEGHLGISNSGI